VRANLLTTRDRRELVRARARHRCSALVHAKGSRSGYRRENGIRWLAPGANNAFIGGRVAAVVSCERTTRRPAQPSQAASLAISQRIRETFGSRGNGRPEEAPRQEGLVDRAYVSLLSYRKLVCRLALYCVANGRFNKTAPDDAG